MKTVEKVNKYIFPQPGTESATFSGTNKNFNHKVTKPLAFYCNTHTFWIDQGDLLLSVNMSIESQTNLTAGLQMYPISPELETITKITKLIYFRDILHLLAINHETHRLDNINKSFEY